MIVIRVCYMIVIEKETNIVGVFLHRANLNGSNNTTSFAICMLLNNLSLTFPLLFQVLESVASAIQGFPALEDENC